MKTLEQVIDANRQSQTIDGRDIHRLLDFIPAEHWEKMGAKLKEGVKPEDVPVREEWTETNILAHLKRDVAFGFDKALGRRGISASCMNEVVKMWMWVLDDPLEDHNSYAQYGLPLLKLVAVKYGFDNPIGEDTGDEGKYADDWE
jgi:hypothetical protein